MAQIWHPTSAETRMWGKRSADMLAIYTSRGVAPEVNLRECISRTPPKSSNKAKPTLALKPRGDDTGSLKQGYQWPQKWTCVQQKFFKKERKKTLDEKSANKPSRATEFSNLFAMSLHRHD